MGRRWIKIEDMQMRNSNLLCATLMAKGWQAVVWYRKAEIKDMLLLNLNLHPTAGIWGLVVRERPACAGDLDAVRLDQALVRYEMLRTVFRTRRAAIRCSTSRWWR